MDRCLCASELKRLISGVIRENDILAVDNAQVRFPFRNAKTGRFESNTAPCPGASIGSVVGEAAVDDVVP